MTTQTPSRRLFAVALATLILSGCATVREKFTDQGFYGSLYSGKSDVAYATQLPVDSVEEAVALGDKAVASRDLDRALYEYIRALNKGGDNAEVLYKIGLIHASRNNRQLAEIAYLWALKTDDEHAGANAGLGILLMQQRRYADAAKRLQRAVQIDANQARAHNGLGVLADMERNYAQAQRHYEAALDVYPKSPLVWNNLGYSRYLSGNAKGAVAAFKEALSYDPSYERAWRNLALVYARDRRYDDAIAALSKVQDPAKAYNDVGFVAMVAGRKKDAASMFDEAIRLSPEYYELASENARRLRTAGR